MYRRSLFLAVAGVLALSGSVRAAVAAENFEEWYRSKTDIGHFLRTWFREVGSPGASGVPSSRQWLSIISEDRDNNRYLLKVGRPGQSSATLAALAVHRLVFFSGTKIAILDSGDPHRRTRDTIVYALDHLPDWMLASRTETRPDRIRIANGNTLHIERTSNSRQVSDLLIPEVALVPDGQLRSTIASVGFARVVMTTARRSYHAPVDCVEFGAGTALDNLFKALGGG